MRSFGDVEVARVERMGRSTFLGIGKGQCGFGSDVVGNLISEDDQKRKLELVVETVRQVWG